MRRKRGGPRLRSRRRRGACDRRLLRSRHLRRVVAPLRLLACRLSSCRLSSCRLVLLLLLG